MKHQAYGSALPRPYFTSSALPNSKEIVAALAAGDAAGAHAKAEAGSMLDIR